LLATRAFARSSFVAHAQVREVLVPRLFPVASDVAGLEIAKIGNLQGV
jgi:hypothetical protein